MLPGLPSKTPWDPKILEIQKTKEGLKHMANAANHLHTGFLKRKPDYDKAAVEYARAALAFRTARQLDGAVEAFMKEAEVHEKKQAFFYAARAHEQAGLLLRELKKLPEAAQAAWKAVSLYLEGKNAELTAATLRRFSHILEDQMPTQVVHLYQGTAELFENEGRLLQALGFTCQASKLLVLAKRYGEAAISLNKEKYFYQEFESFSICYKRTVAQCLAYLHNSDFLAATKCVNDSCSISGFKGSREYNALVQLLESYDKKDQNGLDEICRGPIFKLLDDNYRKMVKKLKVPPFEELSETIMPSPSVTAWPPIPEEGGGGRGEGAGAEESLDLEEKEMTTPE
ncbi:gamma-soluble NSF attachment protein-like [Antechinus flavipes]|uniref:gamma-soluble NSF attachment protein-like n=1 Tax=Antechinus flavipes TaxID=38775 RepID=UPI0022364548|nr:gamma-soluble NSF attachment protein-like [Antechinus flavipes]